MRSRTLDLAIEFLLPEKSTWQITHGQTWLEARQSSSASSYAFRTWRAARLVRQSECEEQARLVRPAIPIAEPESIVEQRPFAAPAGFDSKLVVGVEPTMRGVEGYALVFGSSVGFCYAAVFTTVASGGDAEQTVATRLGVAVDRVFASVKARNVDDRVPRRHLVSGPKSAPAAPSQ
ncbi:MAG TPA: hypothetical protein VHV51_04695 [Polyangiaceae bacterium]|nr:hypothetical protein [Polyangiaceae bacterium]